MKCAIALILVLALAGCGCSWESGQNDGLPLGIACVNAPHSDW